MNELLIAESTPLNANIEVDTLLNTIRLSSPYSIVTVRGILTRLSPYPQIGEAQKYYGEISSKDNSGKISLQTTELNLRIEDVGKSIKFSGSLSVRPSKFHDGLSVMLIGSGEIEEVPAERQNVVTSEITTKIHREYPPVPLFEFFESSNISRFAIIGSEIALKDIFSIVGVPVKSFGAAKVVPFDNPNTILETCVALSEEFDGILIARGGDDSTLGIFDDQNFVAELALIDSSVYTALGHANRFTLADRMADQSFTTPTDAAHRLKSIIQEKDRLKIIDDAMEKIGAHESKADELSPKTFKKILYSSISAAVISVVLAISTATYVIVKMH